VVITGITKINNQLQNLIKNIEKSFAIFPKNLAKTAVKFFANF
jgi:hypothetical protein